VSKSLKAIIFLKVANNGAKIKRLCDAISHYFLRSQAVLITVPTHEIAAYIDQLLWSHPEGKFIPHSIATTKTTEKIAIANVQQNVNESKILFNLCPGASPIADQFDTVLELLDSTTADKLEHSMSKQREYEKLGYTILER